MLERSHTTDDFIMTENSLLDDSSSPHDLIRMSTQNLADSKGGLELNINEANKHFDRQNKNRFQSSDEFLLGNPEEEEKIDTAKPSGVMDYQSNRFMKSKEFLMDSNVMNQTKEVPSGPKSKSVPRNNDFFAAGKAHQTKTATKPKRTTGFGFLSDKSDNQEVKSQDRPKGGSQTSSSKQDMKDVIKKRFAFLETGNEDEEESKEEPVVSEPKQKQVSNPAATGAPEFHSETSSERSENFNFKKKQKNKLNIDTDAINEEFNYGGEKGDLLIRLDSDAENERFLKELDSIASFCVAAMERESPEDEIKLPQSNDPDKQDEDYTNQPLKKRKVFMTPQTMRGFTKVEFAMGKEDDEGREEMKFTKPYMNQEIKPIKEEASPMGTSQSNSSKFSLATPTSTLGVADTPKALMEKAAVEEFNAGIESLYNSILEWLLNRSPSNLNEPLMIDDSDEISNKNVLML